MTQDNEQLRDLLEKLLGTDQARQFEDNLRWSQDLMDRLESPSPSGQTIRQVKFSVLTQLRQSRRRDNIRRFVLSASAAAALFLVVSLVVIQFINPAPSPGKDIWDTDRADAQSVFAAFSGELENISENICRIRLDEDTRLPDIERAGIEIDEIELIADNTDFWKG